MLVRACRHADYPAVPRAAMDTFRIFLVGTATGNFRICLFHPALRNQFPVNASAAAAAFAAATVMHRPSCESRALLEFQQSTAADCCNASMTARMTGLSDGSSSMTNPSVVNHLNRTTTPFQTLAWPVPSNLA
ncbi:MAG: hypothetical protein NTW01_04735 [Gammaproteobacteria bacterium]|nr:hypothetical protein [Gammaproteobacteria bacterium]